MAWKVASLCLSSCLWLSALGVIWLGLMHPPHHFKKSDLSIGSFYERSLKSTKPKGNLHPPVITNITTRLPERLLRLEGEPKKRLFVETVLPLIQIANYETLLARHRLLEIQAKRQPTAEDTAFIKALAAIYELKKPTNKPYQFSQADLKELIKRVDEVPASLALAQAVIESGWGSARLARKGNALFGERVFGTQEVAARGILPLEVSPEANFRLRAHDTLLDGVKSYILNLNTLGAYEDFRSLRALMRQRDEPLDSFLLAGALSVYSEEREGYVLKIQKVMTDNEFIALDRSAS